MPLTNRKGVLRRIIFNWTQQADLALHSNQV